MKRSAITVLTIMLALLAQAQPASISSLVQNGNEAYTAGDYKGAVEQYESALRSGFESAELYFNLGNAYFKADDIPSAVLFYEKALRLDPSDENIHFNLALANSRITDKIEPLPEFFLKSWWNGIRDTFSSNEWASAGIFTFMILLAAVAIFIVSGSVMVRKVSFWTGVILLMFTLTSFLFSLNSYHEYSRQSSAIIFTPTVTVKSSPTDGSVDLFVIHEGTKVFITDRVDDWSEVRLVNGNVGWIKTNSFRPI